MQTADDDGLRLPRSLLRSATSNCQRTALRCFSRTRILVSEPPRPSALQLCRIQSARHSAHLTCMPHPKPCKNESSLISDAKVDMLILGIAEPCMTVIL